MKLYNHHRLIPKVGNKARLFTLTTPIIILFKILTSAKRQENERRDIHSGKEEVKLFIFR